MGIAKEQATDAVAQPLAGAADPVPASAYTNADLAPTTPAQRHWRVKDFLALWVGMSACIPTYQLGSALIAKGMNWWQAVLTVFLANLIVLLPMVLNAHAGTKYGIPFPVYCRASFGIRGANVPAMLRALVACGWFGIQTWIGGWAIYKIFEVYHPGWRDLDPLPFIGITLPLLICFLLFWAINVGVICCGIESIRWLLNIKAPLLIALGLALLGWAWYEVGGLDRMLSGSAQLGARQLGADFWVIFFPALTANVGFWATLSLNIPDFTRYARSQRDQVVGQALGLPTTMGLYSFIGVAVTSATIVLYGTAIWDPVELLAGMQNTTIHVVALLALCLATLATNIAANVVSPANDFANLWPRRITFRTGGMITGVVGILIQPWELVKNADVYIDKWLVGYSALLGAVGGVLIADYFLIRRTKLDADGLYQAEGPYWYRGGFNLAALVALVAGIAPCAPGFLDKVGLMEVPALWTELYNYAWFLSFAVAFGVYLGLTKMPMGTEGTSPSLDRYNQV